MSAKWKDLNMQDVCADWQEDMQDLTVGAIAHGITLSKASPHPPNLGEFVNHCKAYRPPESTVLQLDRKFTVEQIEANQKRIADMVAMLKMSKQA